MIKLLSLIGSLAIGGSNVAPVVELSSNIISKNVNESFDISQANGTVKSERFDYFTMNLYLFDFTARAYASLIINEISDIKTDWDDFKIVSTFNIIENRDLSDEDVLGYYGARTTFIDIRVVPTNAGIEKGLTGEMYYILKMIHQPVDIGIFENLWRDAIIFSSKVNDDATRVTQALRRLVLSEIGKIFQYPTFQNPQTIDQQRMATKKSDGKPFTQEDLDKMNYGESVELSCIFFATQDGRNRGVTGSFYNDFLFVK